MQIAVSFSLKSLEDKEINFTSFFTLLLCKQAFCCGYSRFVLGVILDFPRRYPGADCIVEVLDMYKKQTFFSCTTILLQSGVILFYHLT